MTSAPTTPSTRRGLVTRKTDSATLSQTFRFPAVSPSEDQTSSPALDPSNGLTTQPHTDDNGLLSPGTNGQTSVPILSAQTSIHAKVLSPPSNIGTPRSSGEFYSLSNNSTETLASEYLSQQTPRINGRGAHIRQSSNLGPSAAYRSSETLMMGFAQVQGSFTLDGSLINQAPFEDVKRKGVVGGQGGGVIGVESKKRDSGLLSSFGWGNIGQSIGGFLGGSELSSIKEMRGMAGSKAIPLLSTPQSILFVDLCLKPGDSKSYKYTFKLPRGLPPTHRGKVIKITYSLVIGVQRPGGVREQQVKSVEIPFRVLSSVNGHGELLGHDLMSPYILLRDQALVESLQDAPSTPTPKLTAPRQKIVSHSSLVEFQSYIDQLLSKTHHNSNVGLLSPSNGPLSRRASAVTEASSAKEAIEFAILRSNVTTQSQQSSNRFEIARSGRRVAVIMLARPAYRLGETITAAIDFTNANIPCYAVHAALETSEKVDPPIALRSSASIHRVTRKVHASQSESSLFARRVIFSPTIPMTATPEFLTSGVSFEWKIRIEFVTPKLDDAVKGFAPTSSELLEEISRDERGVILAAAEGIECESFEIMVPIRVYGAVGGSADKVESTEGFVV
jgi:hypothetical protein